MSANAGVDDACRHCPFAPGPCPPRDTLLPFLVPLRFSILAAILPKAILA